MSNCEFELHIPFMSSLPSSMACDDAIPDVAKIYFSQLLTLSTKYGYCWATDQQLAKMKNTSVKNIERWNKILSDNGHIMRKTKNEMVKSKTGGSDKWIKRRKIYCIIKQIEIPKDEEDEIDNSVENEVSNNVCEPLKNEGIYEPLKNEGYKNKPLSETPKEETISSSFPLSLNLLDIPLALKIKLSGLYASSKIDLAVKRALAWKNRDSDERGIMSVLKHFDTWNDILEPDEKINLNVKFLESLKHLDETMISITKILICHKHVEFVCGPKSTVFQVEDPEFIKKTTEYIEYLNQYKS